LISQLLQQILGLPPLVGIWNDAFQPLGRQFGNLVDGIVANRFTYPP
jgi:hypothetical protein